MLAIISLETLVFHNTIIMLVQDTFNQKGLIDVNPTSRAIPNDVEANKLRCNTIGRSKQLTVILVELEEKGCWLSRHQKIIHVSVHGHSTVSSSTVIQHIGPKELPKCTIGAEWRETKIGNDF